MSIRNKKKREIEIQTQIASVALAIEAIESKLIASGIMKENELMEHIVALAQEKSPAAVSA